MILKLVPLRGGNEFGPQPQNEVRGVLEIFNEYPLRFIGESPPGISSRLHLILHILINIKIDLEGNKVWWTGCRNETPLQLAYDGVIIIA